MMFVKLYKALLLYNRRVLLLSGSLAISLVLIHRILNEDSVDNMVTMLILWLGGIDATSSLASGLLRLAFVAVTFIQTSRSIESLQSPFMTFLLPRVGSKAKLLYMYYTFLLAITLIISLLFHGTFFALHIHNSILTTYSNLYIGYAIMDMLSLLSMVSVLFVLEIIVQFEHSVLVIFGIYILNLLLPFANPLAISTSKLGFLVTGNNNQLFIFGSVSLSIILMTICIITLTRQKEII